MTSIYLKSLRGDYLEAFKSCMRQKGKFEYHHVGVKTSTLKRFEMRALVKVVGRRPNVYIVPAHIAEGFREMYPEFER